MNLNTFLTDLCVVFSKEKNGRNESSPLSEQRRSRVVLPLQEINRGKKSEEKEKIYCTEDEEDEKGEKKQEPLSKKKKKNEPREEINELKIKQNNSSLPKKKDKKQN